jgi:uncharacterized protein (TIGR03435 family)
MIRQGSTLTAFDLARASLISLSLFLLVGFAANLPNRHAMGTPQAVQVSHGGAADAVTHGTRATVDRAGRVRRDEGDAVSEGDGAATLHSTRSVLLGPPRLGLRLRREASGGPQNGTLRRLVWQLTLISVIVWLTAFFLYRSRGIGKRVVLAVLGLMGIAASVAFAAVPLPAIHAQILHASAPLPSFEVATVKPRDPKVGLTMMPPGSQIMVRYSDAARRLVAMAYNVSATPQLRVLGGPDWMDDRNKAYVIEGKIPGDVYAQMQTMSADERHNQATLMLQSLLAERFKLKVHFETREMPVYELILGKDGPKLPPPNDTMPAAATPGSTTPQPEMGGGEQVTKGGLRVRNMTLDGMLTAPWFGLGDRPIVNKTGLTGTYNLTLKDWQPEFPMQGPNGVVQPQEGQASIFAVLQEQLGLKLVTGKAPVEVVVIDHIEPPSEN